MGGLSFWHILLLAVVVLVLFGGGRGRFSDMMGDFAKGIKNFKKGLTEEETPPAQPGYQQPAQPQVLPQQPPAQAPAQPTATVQEPNKP